MFLKISSEKWRQFCTVEDTLNLPNVITKRWKWLIHSISLLDSSIPDNTTYTEPKPRMNNGTA